jgi:hypothetical protein
MKRNVGTVDKIVRIIIGLAILVIGIVYKSWWGAIGVLPLITAFARFCPLYTVCGMSTCKVKPPES